MTTSAFIYVYLTRWSRFGLTLSIVGKPLIGGGGGGGGGGGAGGGGWWSGGAKLLSKLSVPGRPTSYDDSGARAYCACSRCGWGFVWIFFFSSIFSLFFLPLFGRWPDID